MKTLFTSFLVLSFLFSLSAQYEIGDAVADFSLKSTDGDKVSMSDYPNAKGYILIFTCNHCPYAIAYEDRIIELHNEMAEKGYPVIAINPNDPEVQPDDSFEKMKERAEEKAFPFKYALDEGQKVYPKFGAERTPHVFLVDSDRILKYIGAIDNNYKSAEAADEHYVRDAISALEAGNDPQPAVTKAIGCTIKTSK
ncbi:MAG: redoxin domain-containing protein [Bacteroidetes bacterium]|jgi:peroxiredoxin|nr:redoxin domain-containing protein [Bacteroidota bacterium]